MEITFNQLNELKNISEQLIKEAGERRIWLFRGEIGAGKTTLIQQIAKDLGVKEAVTSPTFSLVNAYEGSNVKIFHLDLYRLESIDEALAFGIEEYLDSGQYCFIEWPELIYPVLSEDILEIKIDILADSSRKILFL